MPGHIRADEPRTCVRGAFSARYVVLRVVADKRERPWVGDLPGDGEFAGAGEAEQVENGIFYGLNLVRIIEVIGIATGCA